MAVLSPGLIAELASGQGFTGNGLVLAIAVCLAESGGNTLAHNGGTIIDREDSYGLWQINVLAHPEYGPGPNLYNPTSNVRAAWAISNGGSNWNAWGAYTNGSYRKYLGVAQQAAGISAPPVNTGGGGSGGVTPPAGKPWYAFPRIDNLGLPDPFGGFPKPDSNIQLPDGYPVTAILPGTVSATNTTDPWAASITIQLDAPLNTLATHIAYIHLRCDLQVRAGSRVVPGQLIGYNGGGQSCGIQKIPLGFALYAGNNYGHDGWQFMTRSNLSGGPLDPVPLLNLLAQGKLPQPGGILGSGGGFLSGLGTIGFTQGIVPTYVTLSSMTHETLINTPGFYGIALTLDEAEQFPGWIDLTTPQTLNVGPANIPVPDVNGEIRSIGATISDNAIPFFVRSGLVSIGLLLVIALLIKAVEGPAKTLAPLLAA